MCTAMSHFPMYLSQELKKKDEAGNRVPKDATLLSQEAW